MNKKTFEWLSGKYKDLGKRAIVVGAGPSLDKNIDELRMKPKDTIIIATNSAIRALTFRGIRPDYVVSAEETPILTRYLEGIQSINYPLIASSTIHPLFVKKYTELGGDVYFYRNASGTIKNRWEGNTKHGVQTIAMDLPILDPIVGNISFHGVSIARYMGIRDIALIGCDFFAQADKHHDMYYPRGMNSKGTHDRFISALRRSFTKALELSKNVDPDGLVNCTEGGALDTFPRMNLFNWLEQTGKEEKDASSKNQVLPEV